MTDDNPAPPGDALETGPTSPIPALIATIARGLADDPDQVAVTVSQHGRQQVVRLAVSRGDLGRIIGREGRVASAIRTLIAAAPDQDRWGLEIVEGQPAAAGQGQADTDPQPE